MDVTETIALLALIIAATESVEISDTERNSRSPHDAENGHSPTQEKL